MTRKICIITGSRAEYGLLRWLMQEIKDDADLELQIIVTGMHLSPEFGSTHQDITADGFFIDAKVEMLLSSDTPIGIAKSMGLGLIGFSEVLGNLLPDVVVVLGDRFEALAAVQAAMTLGIPIAHISGGELTEGVIDDRIRHAITKMSDFHFVATETYRQRVIQMGEQPSNVLNFGEPALDSFKRLNLLSKVDLEKSIDFSLGNLTFLVTYHPLTVPGMDSELEMRELLYALEQFTEAQLVITKGNADSGGRALSKMVDDYCLANPTRVFVTTSLGQLRYLSALQACDVVIGNSSSGIVEAPALLKPTVNIGSRQTGRLKAKSIIDCGANRNSIVTAINLALSRDFQETLGSTKSLYGDSNASIRIKDYLKQVRLEEVMSKSFFDINFSAGA